MRRTGALEGHGNLRFKLEDACRWWRVVLRYFEIRDGILAAIFDLTPRAFLNVKLRDPMRYEEVSLRAFKQTHRQVSLLPLDIEYWVNVLEAPVSPTCHYHSRIISRANRPFTVKIQREVSEIKTKIKRTKVNRETRARALLPPVRTMSITHHTSDGRLSNIDT